MQIPPSSTASGLGWVPRAADARLALAMAQQHGIPEALAEVLAGRGVALDAVPQFLMPTLREQLPDPLHLQGMAAASARLADAVQAGETIAVFGDYDVDGATSTALLWHYLAPLGVRFIPYIPDRMKEGYGPSTAAFDQLIAQGATLIVTVDCGTLAHAPIQHARAKGVDVIVLDHHLSDGDLPDAFAIVNPNRVDETSPYTNLAAVGVTFLALVALNRVLHDRGFFRAARPAPSLLALLDLVALGTVCDVMPLTGLNRAFVAQGLKQLATRQQRGLAALADVANLHELPSAYHLGFIYGPRINAGGRVGESNLGVRLLTSADDAEIAVLAARLHQHNAERQAIEVGVLEAALAQAATQANASAIVVAGEGWHPGVIGIVAGRLKEKFARPAAVIALEGGVGKGSARSVPGADMGAAVHAGVTTGLLTQGGGHAMAAGFSLDAAQLSAFHTFLCERLGLAVTAYAESRVRKLDGWISCQSAQAGLIEDLARAAPYGLGNPSPRFGIRAARIVHRKVMKEKHLRLVLCDEAGNARLNAVAFNVGDSQLGAWLATAPSLHLAGELTLNRWQGQESPQFIIEDAARVM
jgi:single-stranded-DNA-specific exonuclease